MATIQNPLKIVNAALELIQESSSKYLFKNITINDTGIRSHQAGIYIHKDSGKMLFNKSFKKGENVHDEIVIHWYDSGLKNHCRFIYYGKGFRTDEFRITRLSRRFQIGDFLLLILIDEEYVGFVFNEYQEAYFKKQLYQSIQE